MLKAEASTWDARQSRRMFTRLVSSHRTFQGATRDQQSMCLHFIMTACQHVVILAIWCVDMLTMSVISQKGGAGKSTLAIHLATEASAQGLRSLLIDLDPQGNASKWGDRRGDRSPDVSAEHPAKLDAVLAAARIEGYGIVIFDTAPHADQTALRAARASDLVLIPCRPATFDLEAIQATLDLCTLAKKQSVVVVNAAPTRSRVVDEATRAVLGHGGQVSDVIVRQRVAFQHCMIDGRTAGEFEPGGAAAQEITDLYADMLTRCHAKMSVVTHIDVMRS